MSLTIIIPCLNEEKNIASVLTKIYDYKKYHFKHNLEVIVINDGSKDSTENIVNHFIENLNIKPKLGLSFKILSHKTNKGLGASFKTGLKHAKNDNVLVMPGDDENEIKEILRHYEIIKNVDIIIPFIINKNLRSMFRRILSSVYTKLINLFFGTNFNYTNGTIIFTKVSLESINIKTNDFFYNTEILIKLIRTGYTFVEVPSLLSCRSEGVSKAISIKSLFKVIKSFTKTYFEIMILRKNYSLSKKSNTYINFYNDSFK